jgi:hypothetical protein
MKKKDGQKVDRKITDRNISQGKRTKKQDRKIRGRKMTDELTGDNRGNRELGFSSVFSVCSCSNSSFFIGVSSVFNPWLSFGCG